LTVCNQLKLNQKLEEAGGFIYVSTLTNRIVRLSAIAEHIKILQQYYLARWIHVTCDKSRHKLFNAEHDVFDVYQNLQDELDNGLKEILHYETTTVKDVHKRTILEKLEQIKKGIKSGTPSGLQKVDNFTGGWQKSDLIIFAGRPGMGKTSLAVSILVNIAVIYNEPVAFFSLEMSKEQVVGRIQSGLSGYDVSKIITNKLTEEEWMDLAEKAKALEVAPIHIDDAPGLTITELKVKARKLVREANVKVIMIDYLQLLRTGQKLGNREQEIAEISKNLKILAKELNIPVIALSQLSRDVEKRGGSKKPTLSDLRESGQIEQDADMIFFCYRPEYYEIEEYYVGNQEFDVKNLFMLIAAKNRNGKVGEIPLTFIQELTKVVNHNEYYEQIPVMNNALKNSRNFDSIDTNVLYLPNEKGNDEVPF